MTYFWQKFVQSVFAQQALEEYCLEIGALSDVGRQRESNQDQIGYSKSADNKTVLAIVADGMGGHQGGEVASRLAVELILQDYGNGEQHVLSAKELKRYFNRVNTAIYHQAQGSAALQGMGTTLVSLAIAQGMACYAFVGDSRLYLLRAGECRQLSKDHTVVAEMLKQGLITAEAAVSHPDKNVITRAIGTYSNVDVDSSNKPLPIKIGDCFLLCSDGLHDLVNATEMQQALVEHTAQQACEVLIQLANSRGGHDNISVLVVKVLQSTASAKNTPITRA
ncbi:MAG: Stp1/IreP family PP2C-type Ser/Thr phosphatase [Methylococcaceae bacterium]|nr:Stp1/IreP family PP2C-type Ser/Thr phosphatase [Methylococcaceae bacterium]